MNRLARAIADAFRPFYRSGLDADHQLPDVPVSTFLLRTMERMAAMSAGVGVTFGVFEVIGLEHARRAARAWRPGEILLMEEVSLAFHEVEERVLEGGFLPAIHVDRLVMILGHYLDRIGRPRDEAEIREAVARYVANNTGRRKWMSEDDE
jgi:hypothetical protein